MPRRLRYLIEGLFVTTAFRILSLLPYGVASGLCGRLLRCIGPFLGRTKTARRNLTRAMPELNAAAIDRIIGDMWENLGRVMGEFPHVGIMTAEEFSRIVSVEGTSHIIEAQQGATGSIFFSAHLANWELVPKTLAVYDYPMALVYRRGNNPQLDRLIQGTRKHYQTEGIAKGAAGSRQLIRALRQQRPIGMLLDQKMNTGIPVGFFGREVMTATAIANLALKFDCPIIPIRIIRSGGIRHRVSILPPLTYARTGDEATDIHNIMTLINTMLEQWIREYPAQWIWVHNRWPDEADDRDDD